MDRLFDARRNVYLYIIIFLTFFAYLPALYDLVADWYNDPNYSHGFLVPLISIFLIWRRRRELAEVPLSSSRWGLALIIIGMIFFIIGNGASEYFTVRLSLIIVIFGMILYFFGRRFLQICWFPLIFLIFMIPIPYVIYYSVTFPMQLLASKVAAFFLQLLGMTVIRQGNIIHLPQQALEVAEACSGMRSLLALLALGALFAWSYQKKFAAQLIMFLATVPIAVIGNIVRVFITALIVYTSPELKATDEPLHSIMGASVFVIAFILLLITGAILKKIFKP